MTAGNETREANIPRNWQSANCLKGFVSKIIITSEFYSSTVCVFGENPKNPKKCTLITFNTKLEETLIAEVDYRWGCAVGCINGMFVLFF